MTWVNLSYNGLRAPIADFELCVVDFSSRQLSVLSVCVRAQLHPVLFGYISAAADCVPCTLKHPLDVFYTSVLVVTKVCVCVCVCVCVFTQPKTLCAVLSQIVCVCVCVPTFAFAGLCLIFSLVSCAIAIWAGPATASLPRIMRHRLAGLYKFDSDITIYLEEAGETGLQFVYDGHVQPVRWLDEAKGVFGIHWPDKDWGDAIFSPAADETQDLIENDADR